MEIRFSQIYYNHVGTIGLSNHYFELGRLWDESMSVLSNLGNSDEHELINSSSLKICILHEHHD